MFEKVARVALQCAYSDTLYDVVSVRKSIDLRGSQSRKEEKLSGKAVSLKEFVKNIGGQPQPTSSASHFYPNNACRGQIRIAMDRIDGLPGRYEWQIDRARLM